MDSCEIGDLRVTLQSCGMELRDVGGTSSQQIGAGLAHLQLQQPLEGDVKIGEPVAYRVPLALKLPDIGGASDLERGQGHPVTGRWASSAPADPPLKRSHRPFARGRPAAACT